MLVPGCEYYVALDRLYSDDSIWVVKLSNDTVQIGMSDTLQATVSVVINCWLTPPGTVLRAEDAFGYVEAEKLNADLLSPVSGKVLTINAALMSAKRFESPINSDPYGAGWMATIQISNPAELKTLYTPQYFAYLKTLDAGTKWPGPVPQKYP
jgi:glycine cleavage system H protein